MTKYYRVIKDTFIWEKDAILSNKECSNGYMPIEDIWNKFSEQAEYITTKFIENNPEWFERVYTDNLEKMMFKTKDQLKEAYNKFIK